MTAAPFQLTDEEGLVFDEHPHLFVHLDQSPIVWTVRGLAYFVPRFKRIGIPVDRIRNRADFVTANETWLQVEKTLVMERVRQASLHGSVEHQILQAILDGDTSRAAALQRGGGSAQDGSSGPDNPLQ